MESLNEVNSMQNKDIVISDDQIHAGCLTLYPQKHEVWRDGDLVLLTRMEYALLLYLIYHANNVIGREELMLKVWGYAACCSTRTVDVHVLRIRKKLQISEAIQTVHRVGYLFNTMRL